MSPTGGRLPTLHPVNPSGGGRGEVAPALAAGELRPQPATISSQGIDHRSFRHWGGYIFGGTTAFLVDFAVIVVAHHRLGIDPFWANVIGLSVATCVAWILHRTITFSVQYPPSVAEFVRFFVIAWAANGVSLAVNTLLLWAVPAMSVEVAFLISRCFGGAAAYIGFRFGVFRHFKDA